MRPTALARRFRRYIAASMPVTGVALLAACGGSFSSGSAPPEAGAGDDGQRWGKAPM
jgi:hypothetical protein